MRNGYYINEINGVKSKKIKCIRVRAGGRFDRIQVRVSECVCLRQIEEGKKWYSC